MTAIQTFYHDVHFRSRIEARWAIFLDTLNIPWEYEKEGYVLNGACYLPDFWLPDQKRWLEIKGEYPSTEEEGKAFGLAEATGYPVHIFYGHIPSAKGLEAGWSPPEYPVFMYELIDGIGGLMTDTGYVFGRCPGCGIYDIAYEGRAERFGCDCYDREKDKMRTYNDPTIITAYTAARTSRFEHPALSSGITASS